MKRFLQVFFSVIAILLIVPSITILTSWYQVTNANLYKSALNQSGIYQTTGSIMQSYTTAAINELRTGVQEEVSAELVEGEDSNDLIIFAANQLIDSFFEEKTPGFVSNVYTKLEVEQKMQTTVEDKIDFTTGWLRGEEQLPNYMNYLPTDERLDNLQEEGYLKFLTSIVIIDILGLNNLPECSTTEAEQEAINKVLSGEAQEISCKSPQVLSLTLDSISDKLPTKVFNLLDELLGKFINENNLNGLEDTIFEGVRFLNSVKATALDAQTYMLAIRSTGFIMLILAIISAVVGIWLSKDKIKWFTAIFSTSGLLILIGVVAYRFPVRNFVVENINTSEISIANDVITNAQSAAWLSSLNKTIELIFNDLSNYTVTYGILLLMFPLIIYGLNYLYKMYSDGKDKINLNPSESPKSKSKSKKAIK